MTQGPLWRMIIVYTVPIIMTGLLQLLFMAVDLIIAGRFCGSIALAAVGATGALINLIVNLFIGAVRLKDMRFHIVCQLDLKNMFYFFF